MPTMTVDEAQGHLKDIDTAGLNPGEELILVQDGEPKPGRLTRDGSAAPTREPARTGINRTRSR